ncbi:hypothetical protein MJI37_29025, partial [Salmonella enterica subsp. enterica serovar Cerro]|nr:hypothetical protein [Salmonella enterica subsp. enterica serovar Cerro]
MNRFIMANSQQCLGCHACEVASYSILVFNCVFICGVNIFWRFIMDKESQYLLFALSSPMEVLNE